MKDDNILDNFNFEEPEFPWDEQDAEVVGKFFALPEAEIAAARLRSEGIPCFLANSTSQAVLPHIQGIVRLHVRPVDVDLAREILAEAAIDAAPIELASSRRDNVLTVLALMIGLILAGLLVKAVSGRF